MDEKQKVARLSIISNTVLTMGKLGAGLAMGSVSVISEAIHSGMDLIASAIAFISVSASGKPADREHRYGHGKFENIAAIIEALLILGAAALIIVQSVPKLFGGTEVESLGLGAMVMGGSALVNFWVSQRLMSTAKRTDSPALAADAWHLRTDVYTSLGVFAGIIAIKLTGLVILDPIIALGVTAFIVKAAIDLIRESISSIVDASLPENEEQLIREVLEQHSAHYVQFHNLRTRRAGPDRHVDLHLVVPRRKPIISAHDLCDRIEEDVQKNLPGVHVLIHAEPCKPGVSDCTICNFRERGCEPGGEKKDECIDCGKCEKE